MQFENRFSKMVRRSQSGILAALLTASLATVACEESDLCSDDACADDAGGDPGRDDDSASGGKDSGKGSGGKGSGGLGGAPGSGGKSGSAGGDSGSGGKKTDGSGGQQEAEPEPGAIEGRVTSTLYDVLPGGTVDVKLQIERKRGFEGTVLVSLKSSDEFSGSQVFVAPNEDEVSLTIHADFELEQGYYETTLIAESTDDLLNIDIPLSLRVRGAPGTLDLTFGDHEMPWFGEGTQAGAAVDDAGYTYLHNESTIFRFDPHGALDESFKPEGLGTQLGPMIGMENGVLIGTRGPAVPDQVIHFLGSAERNPSWTGSPPTEGELPPTVSLQSLPFSLHRQGEKVAVAAEYSYPYSWVQLFSVDGRYDAAFEKIYFYNSSGNIDVHARLDSQGRVLGTRRTDGTIHRLLPNGSLDTTFADKGALVLAGGGPNILDFEVLSDDGLAILVQDTYPAVKLAIWTPSNDETSGSLVYHDLPSGATNLLRLEGDRLLTTGREGDRWPPTLIRMYERTGQPVASFGTAGAVHLNEMGAQHYAPVPPFDRLGWKEPALDRKGNRLIAHGTDLGKLYLYSIWL